MPEVLQEKKRKAKKVHKCSYCGCDIEIGETYAWTKLVYERRLYEWKAHEKCDFISQEIWNYVDPDEGMTDEDFLEGVHDVCCSFVCPECTEPSKESDSCYFCLDKVYALLQTHRLKRVRDEHDWLTCFKMVPREGDDNGKRKSQSPV